MFLRPGHKLAIFINAKKKRSLVAFSVLATSIVLGFMSFLTFLVSGYLIAKYLGSKKIGERGKVPSVRFYMGKYKLHLHHWLISIAAMALPLLRGWGTFPAELYYGLGCGIAFQGIYCYSDWHRILTLRQPKVQPELELPEAQ